MWWIWISKLLLFLFTIYLGHIAWDYVKNIISKPKTKDLVNIQTDKYRNIIQELSDNLLTKTNDSLLNSLKNNQNETETETRIENSNQTETNEKQEKIRKCGQKVASSHFNLLF
jgi:biopolymer transport protein ExbB/TolQ